MGRSASCDIAINDSLISGKHFRIFIKQVDGVTEALLEDLRFFFFLENLFIGILCNLKIQQNSTNGTYLEGRKVGQGKTIPLNDKDEIRVDFRLNNERTEATDQIRKKEAKNFSNGGKI